MNDECPFPIWRLPQDILHTIVRMCGWRDICSLVLVSRSIAPAIDFRLLAAESSGYRDRDSFPDASVAASNDPRWRVAFTAAQKRSRSCSSCGCYACSDAVFGSFRFCSRCSLDASFPPGLGAAVLRSLAGQSGVSVGLQSGAYDGLFVCSLAAISEDEVVRHPSFGALVTTFFFAVEHMPEQPSQTAVEKVVAAFLRIAACGVVGSSAHIADSLLRISLMSTAAFARIRDGLLSRASDSDIASEVKLLTMKAICETAPQGIAWDSAAAFMPAALECTRSKSIPVCTAAWRALTSIENCLGGASVELRSNGPTSDAAVESAVTALGSEEVSVRRAVLMYLAAAVKAHYGAIAANFAAVFDVVTSDMQSAGGFARQEALAFLLALAREEHRDPDGRGGLIGACSLQVMRLCLDCLRGQWAGDALDFAPCFETLLRCMPQNFVARSVATLCSAGISSPSEVLCSEALVVLACSATVLPASVVRQLLPGVLGATAHASTVVRNAAFFAMGKVVAHIGLLFPENAFTRQFLSSAKEGLAGPPTSLSAMTALGEIYRVANVAKKREIRVSGELLSLVSDELQLLLETESDLSELAETTLSGLVGIASSDCGGFLSRLFHRAIEAFGGLPRGSMPRRNCLRLAVSCIRRLGSSDAPSAADLASACSSVEIGCDGNQMREIAAEGMRVALLALCGCFEPFIHDALRIAGSPPFNGMSNGGILTCIGVLEGLAVKFPQASGEPAISALVRIASSEPLEVRAPAFEAIGRVASAVGHKPVIERAEELARVAAFLCNDGFSVSKACREIFQSIPRSDIDSDALRSLSELAGRSTTPRRFHDDMSGAVNLEQARLLVSDVCVPGASETVEVSQALGRVVSEKVVSKCNSPDSQTSTRDGWAVDSACPLDSAKRRRIATGMPLPDGTNCVVPCEWSDEQAAGIEPGQFVAPPGADVRLGAVLASEGDEVTPRRQALMVAANVSQCSVHAVPKVCLIATGDELVGPEHSCVPKGAIRASNIVSFKAELERRGVLVIGSLVVPDCPSTISGAISSTLSAGTDAIVMTGGVWGGSERDVSVGSMASVAGWSWQTIFRHVKLGPGKSTSFGTLTSDNELRKVVPVFCLSGGPDASEAGFFALVLPGMAALQGRIWSVWGTTPVMRLPLAKGQSWKGKSGPGQSDWAQLLPAVVNAGNSLCGSNVALLCLESRGSEQRKQQIGRLERSALKSAFVFVPMDCRSLVEGDVVDVLLL